MSSSYGALGLWLIGIAMGMGIGRIGAELSLSTEGNLLLMSLVLGAGVLIEQYAEVNVE